jgi:hypothetical protein
MHIRIILCIIGILIAALPFTAFGQPVTGACCHPDGSCSDTFFNEGDCEEDLVSIWQGDGTVCQPNPCPQQQPLAIPTFSEWGMIILMVLSGVGSVYYLRRQKRAES